MRNNHFTMSDKFPTQGIEPWTHDVSALWAGNIRWTTQKGKFVSDGAAIDPIPAALAVSPAYITYIHYSCLNFIHYLYIYTYRF